MWLRFARSCEYLDSEAFETLNDRYDRVCGGLVQMMEASEKWCSPTDSAREPSVLYDTE